MPHDQQTYQRAAHAALIGLFTQLVLALGVALTGLYAESMPLHVMSWYFFGGLPIWLILWLVFNQQRLELAEAMEAEELARADARTAALFDEAGHQLQMARRRLESILKFAVPAISLFVAIYLLGLGLVYAMQSWDAFQAGRLDETAMAGGVNTFVIGVMLVGVAFIGFLVSRYVSGMTRVAEWQLLRGGAAYLMGNVVVAGLAVVGALFAYFDNPTVLGVLALVVPAFMIVLAVEIFIAFTLNIYRPRRPGEIGRPAFDSRVLGWLTRPESLGKIVSETLNYQFGFEISRSWFYGLLSRALLPLIVLALVVLIGLTSFVVIPPHQQAVITRFGAQPRVVDAGLRVKWPWPVGRADLYDVHSVNELSVGSGGAEGYDRDRAVLWTNDHVVGEEMFLLTAPTTNEEERSLPTADLMGAEMQVQYRIKNLEQYIRAAAEPEALLRQIAERRMMRYFATRSPDALLTTERRLASGILREQIQQDVDRFVQPDGTRGLGLEIVFAGLTSVHPPQRSEVAAKFHEQIGAMQRRETAIQGAYRDAVVTLAEVAGSSERALAISNAIGELEALQTQLQRARSAGDAEQVEALDAQIARQAAHIETQLDQAGGRAMELIYEARAYRWTHALSEQAWASNFQSLAAANANAPDYFKARYYLDAMAQGMAKPRKYIFSADPANPPMIRLNLGESEGGFESMMNLE